jgi:hypothetical protein
MRASAETGVTGTVAEAKRGGVRMASSFRTFLDDTPPNPPGFVPPVFRAMAKTMVNKLLIALSNG